MTRRALLLVVLVAACGAPEPAPEPPPPAPALAGEPAPVEAAVVTAPPPREPQPLTAEEARRLGVGDRPALPFAAALASHRGAAVVVLTSLRCPVARLYAPGLADLRARHPDAALVVVDVAARDTPADLEEAARRHGWSDPIVVHKDDDLSVVRALRAQRTTECFVLDAAGVLRYRGAIDDQYGQGYRRAAPRRRYLEDALAAVLAGEEVAVPATSAPGCVVALD